MKSVLISIQPKWCELIASGKKTIEVRKTAPKLQTPFKCYIYKTKKCILRDIAHKGDSIWGCDKIADKTEIVSCPDLDGGKVIGEFVCDSIDIIAVYNEQLYAVEHFQINILQQSCLTIEEVKAYLGAKNRGTAWHISDLKIYDKPRELGEFKSVKVIRGYHKENETGIERLLHSKRVQVNYLTRPPQSWCYVEEL